MNCYDNVVPIWGIQTMEELEQWLALAGEEPELDAVSAPAALPEESVGGTLLAGEVSEEAAAIPDELARTPVGRTNQTQFRKKA